jgi:hypothetical protein
VVAVAGAGSALVGRVALAAADAGGTGTSDSATNDCLTLGILVLSEIGVLSQPGPGQPCLVHRQRQ